jgi:hypothetical protein
MDLPIIRLHNAGAPFTGWVHCTTDQPITGIVSLAAVTAYEGDNGTVVVLGGMLSSDVQELDVFVRDLPAGDTTLHISDMHPVDYDHPPFDAVYPLSIAGIPMEHDPASYRSMLRYYRCRITAMVYVDLWVRIYPGPYMLQSLDGIVLFTASNDNVLDLSAECPQWAKLMLGSVEIPLLGLPLGETFDDGQCRVAMFRGHSVTANGLRHVWPQGDPAPFVNVEAWLAANRVNYGRLFSWAAPGIAVVPDSTVTGRQEDQLFVGAEMAYPHSAEATRARHVAALSWGKRPCHHLTEEGRIHSPSAHPNLLCWMGRAHYSVAASLDQLGKPRALNKAATKNGWWGPDEEHWFLNSVCVAYRATGCPVLRHYLEHQAFLLSKSVNYRPGALRAVGWKGLLLWWLDKLDIRWDFEHPGNIRSFFEQVLVEWRAKPWQQWSVTRHADEVRDTGWAQGTQPWQHGLACYGLTLAAETLNMPNLADLAYDGAKGILDPINGAWQLVEGRWKGWGYVGVNPNGMRAPLIEGAGAHFGPGVEVWMALGVATVLRRSPSHEIARAVWDQYCTERREDGKWLPPEVLHLYCPDAG